MRDIVPKVSANRPSEQRSTLCKDTLRAQDCEMRRTHSGGGGEIIMDLQFHRKQTPDMDEESVGSQDSGASISSVKSDIPTYQSYRKYLDGYSTLKFKPVKMAKTEAEAAASEAATTHAVDGGVARCENSDDARVHKAEIVIQVKPPQPITPANRAPQVCQQIPPASIAVKHIMSTPPPAPPTPCDDVKGTTNCGVVPPPPPPFMPHVLPSKIITVASPERAAVRTVHKPLQRDLKSCLMDELKAKHAPREYPLLQEVERGAGVRRTSEPINAPHTINTNAKIAPIVTDAAKPKPPLPAYPSRAVHNPVGHTPPQKSAPNTYNSLPRRWSEQQQQIAAVLANADAQTVTKVPSPRRDGPVDRDDPSVKKLVYATLRNYVGAYNNRANRIVAQHGHAVQDKGVTEQINSILASGNMAHLNGRINPKESE